jgi:hypothetical protein
MPWSSTRPRNNDYGTAHQAARRAYAAKHQPDDPCVRCGHALGPIGPWLHLDHNAQRTGYLGFSHGSRRCPTCGKRCNLRAAALVANTRRAGAKPPRAPKLKW